MTHPTPLVPLEVDLRGLPWMRLDTQRLTESDLFALSSGAEFKAAVSLWCKSWTQKPGGSLPNDDRILWKLSAAESLSLWKKIKVMALRGWIECDDGRLYHPVVAEQALVAWEERVSYRAKKEGDAARKQQERVERDQMCEVLRATGHKIPWNITTRDLRGLYETVTNQSRVTGGDASQGYPTDIQNLSPAKRGTGRDGTGYSIGNTSTSAENPKPPNDSGALGEQTPGSLSDAQASGVVHAAKALRKIGIRIQPQDPTLIALVAEKYTTEQMALAAAEKALKIVHLWNDSEVHPDLHEMLASAATQQQMMLTNEQYAAVRSAACEVGIGYIASTLRGRRRDAASQQTGSGNGNARAIGTAAAGKVSAVERVKAANLAAEQRERGLDAGT